MIVNDYLARLEQNTNQTLQVLSTFPEKDLVNELPENKWNPMQILEHIYLTDKLVYIILSRPQPDFSEKKELVGDEKLKRIIVGMRQKRVEAPERLHPKGIFKAAHEFEKAFVKTRNELRDDLLSEKIVADNRICKHPLLGDMTMTDWLNFIIRHTERHLQQINDLKGAG